MTETMERRKLCELPLDCSSCARCPAIGCSMRSRAYSPELARFNRRTLVAGGIGTVAGLTLIQPGFSQSASTATAEACVTLTPEMTEGPYYIDDLLLRDDITEGRPGVPLELAVSVIDVASCEPVPDAAVDIWHCDALGDYSGIGGQMGNDDTTGQTLMRGVQLTDQSGLATITTIYPGWYVGRTIHIHIKVHTGGTAEDGTYLGGTTAHTGQLYFDDVVTDQVAQLEPYSQRLGIERTLNAQDGVLGQTGAQNPAFFIELTPKDAADLSKGFAGKAVLGIDVASAALLSNQGGA